MTFLALLLPALQQPSPVSWFSVPAITTFVGILTAIGSAVWAWRRAKPDVSHTLVDAASDVVVIQRGFIKQQAMDMERMKRRIEELEKKEQEHLKNEKRLQDVIEKLNDRIQLLEEDCGEKKK